MDPRARLCPIMREDESTDGFCMIMIDDKDFKQIFHRTNFGFGDFQGLF